MSGSVLRHVVLFGFKPTAAVETVQAIERAFCELPSRIPLIRAFEWGTDVSPEGLAQGHTHAYLLTFESAADRDAYLVHADHVRFVQLLEPQLERATVVDYWSKTSS